MTGPRLESVAFSSLEIGDTLAERKDTTKYQTGLRRARNVLGLVGGGFYNRPGLEWCGAIKNETHSANVLPFQFSVGQSYVLEFGEFTMRVVFNGGLVTEPALLITDITQANPGVVSVTAHGYQTGDDVYFSDVAGMVQLNGRTIRVTRIGADSFSLDGVDTSTYAPFTGSGGGVAGDAAGGDGGYPPGGPPVVVTPPFPDVATPPVLPNGAPPPDPVADDTARFTATFFRAPYGPYELNYWLTNGYLPSDVFDADQFKIGPSSMDQV